MRNFSGEPWSDHPNAPKISEQLYLSEKASSVALLIAAVLYGVNAAMFFQCMSALLSPIRRKEKGVKQPLIAYAAAMFLFATVSTVTCFYVQIIAFIDNRNYTGVGKFPPGPVGYLRFTSPKAISVVSYTPMVLNGWLSDGLLLYRCHVVYAMKKRIIAFPSLVYLASFGIGFMYLFQDSQGHTSYWNTRVVCFGFLYITISLSLNVLLTLMIVVRLILHHRMIRNAIGDPSTIVGLSSSSLYIASWIIQSYLVDYFCAIFLSAQVIAPFLIILRVANRTALTSEDITGDASSIRFRSQVESTEGDETSDDGDPTSSADRRRETLGGVHASAGGAAEAPPS